MERATVPMAPVTVMISILSCIKAKVLRSDFSISHSLIRYRSRRGEHSRARGAHKRNRFPVENAVTSDILSNDRKLYKSQRDESIVSVLSDDPSRIPYHITMCRKDS